MAGRRALTVSPDVERRMEEIRGTAPRRSPTVRALAAYAQHTECNLATLGFTAGVDFDRLLVGTQFEAPFGQSPFAFRRGVAFEQSLRARNYAATLELLRAQLKYPVEDARIVNLRDVHPATRAGMLLRARDTMSMLKLLVDGKPTAPNLIDGAVLETEVGGVRAFFEADALAARSAGQVHVAEVKSFPKVDERVDPDKLGAALDQVAIYILLTRDVIGKIGGDPDRLVSENAMLITPLNVGLKPTISVKNVAPRITRIHRLLTEIPNAADVAAAVPGDISLGPVGDKKQDEKYRLDVLDSIADSVGTAYKPSCLTTCGNAQFCRARAFQEGAPCIVGNSALRLLPNVSNLQRAEELTRGAPPAPEERPAAEILARAGRAYDSLAISAPTTARRRAK